MLLLVLEKAPPKLIGYCSSWAVQVATGVYVANLPKRTREQIWDQVLGWANFETRAVMVWDSTSTEQGLECRVLGKPRRTVSRREGLLVSTWIPAEETPSGQPE